MILLDTTILVYGVGSEHALREPCRSLISAIAEGRIAGTTTVEVIQEFAHVRARRRGRADAARLAGSYATLLGPLQVVDQDDLAAGLDLYANSTVLGAFDSILSVVARRRPHITAIASADRAFGEVVGLSYLDPADPDFAASFAN